MRKRYSLCDLTNGKSCSLYNFAKELIPGGTQLLSKRPEMFAPNVWPAYYSRAKGAKIWDLDHREFLDMSIMGVGANILGYADEDVDQAVLDAVKSGVSCSLNSPKEVELAELLIELHPWFGMVRYTRAGGEAMNVAVRIARAHTGKSRVLFSGYHGWNDWYLAANIANKQNLDGQLMPGLMPAGVPRELHETSIPFSPDDFDGLLAKIKGKENEIAAMVIEPARGRYASGAFLTNLRELCDELGAVLIFDEITSGFRECAGGLHRLFGVKPDVAVFAKSIANGYPLGVVIGTESVMDSAQKTFISSTNWTDSIGPAAAIACIKKYIENNVSAHIENIGKQFQNGFQRVAREHKISVKVGGLPSLCSFEFDNEEERRMNTFLTLEMLQYGVLGFRQFKPSFAHTDDDVVHYLNVLNEVFSSLHEFDCAPQINSPLQHVGFSRLTKE